MTAAITGAAIGFLVWAAWVVFIFGTVGPGERVMWGKVAAMAVVLTGSGAAIGWLIGGGL